MKIITIVDTLAAFTAGDAIVPVNVLCYAVDADVYKIGNGKDIFANLKVLVFEE